MIRFLAIAFVAFTLSGSMLHEYYVSVARARYNAESKRLEVGLKVFTDDLERTLGQLTGEPVKLSNPKESNAAEEPLATYLEQRFLVMQGGKLMEQFFVGMEPGPDETWLYFEIAMPASGTFSIKNTVLFDVFPAQVNILHLDVNGHQQSQYFNADQPLIDVTLP